MKKIAFIFAAVAAIFFSACSSCEKSKPEMKDVKEVPALVDTTETNFEAILYQIVPEVNKAYPEYSFFEASALMLKTENGYGVDANTFEAAFGCPTHIGCVKVEVVHGKIIMTHKDAPWLEDMYMSPYVPMKMDMAVEEIQKKINIEFPDGTPVVLRHQLFYAGENEPRFFFGSAFDCHTVNVYSYEVDKNAGESSDK